MEDIREAHGRSGNAPETSVVEELKRDLEEVTNFKQQGGTTVADFL